MNGGSDSLLTAARTQSLIKHPEENLYVKVSDIFGYVYQTFGIRYSVSGMSSRLKRQDFTFYREIPTNGSQKRLNILGALDLEKMTLKSQVYDTINGANIIAFPTYLMTMMPCGVIHIILDQARYHTFPQKAKTWTDRLTDNFRIIGERLAT